LQGLHRSATRLREQIESVLHYVERPGLTEGPAVTVGQIEPLFRRIAGAVSQSGVRCEVADGLVEARLPLTAAALEVILTELVTNAVKFHPDHRPELSLCVTASEPDRCAIALLDNGLTLPEDKLGELARPYYQAEEYFTGETPGMGLGLAMVSTLATEQGGRLSLHNRAPGPGIEARVVLPLHEG